MFEELETHQSSMIFDAHLPPTSFDDPHKTDSSATLSLERRTASGKPFQLKRAI